MSTRQRQTPNTKSGMKRREDTIDDGSNSSSSSSSRGSRSTSTERPGLVTLPPDLGRRLVGFLDGGGLGGTLDLYALSCTHRSLASCAGLATRLEVRDSSVDRDSLFTDAAWIKH